MRFTYSNSKALIYLLRPHQWIKSSFIFAGIIFAHAWQNKLLLQKTILTALAFSFVASAMYVFNDISDRETDRLHPAKKHRPIAAGKINIFTGALLGTTIGIIGITLGFSITVQIGLILLGYIFLNIAYSQFFKNLIIFDVFIIASGFLLRVLAGTTGIGIPPSNWLLLCTLFLTLFLGFSKRYADHLSLQKLEKISEKKSYSKNYLIILIGACALGSILSYTLYTTHQDKLLRHPQGALIYTTPFVALGIFRYLYLINNKKNHGLDVASDIIYDAPLLLTLLTWLTFILFALTF